MKKIVLSVLVSFISLFLLSWGVIGHRAIGKIAENHLTSRARDSVKALLGTESLADVSTYADEIRSQDAFKNTGAWHYINLPLGLSESDFIKKVSTMVDENVYSALVRSEHELTDSKSTRDQKIFALKFIVHLVGDLHQPMHVSREEDKGGNTIQLNYNGKGTNLHRLWDSGLIEKQGYTFEQVAVNYDSASPAEIKKMQSDGIMTWIYESYLASSILYAEVDSMKSRSIDDHYTTRHLPVVEERIEKAGIRLAGLLNLLFEGGKINTAFLPAASETKKTL